ncbi:ureidoglycolate lyase [Thalassobaculum fulvum]|jgi:ureidoglycolate lyase|uniref:Ureidoglycolate lyase n=1 Tax=Thalassobaculum fulvum TaxID=1633335 RepID=A0A919CQZ7_9PROT|nr:ureidoglycolate lyase [Thalassobaculum fulvum]GHD57169.1 ureidoglycolate lyase [Thalassobaculum fulvum]
MRLVAEPITEAAFAPFGQLLALPTEAGRVDYSAFAENLRPGKASVCFRTSLTAPSSLPLKTRVMERHAFSSQAFLPVDVARYVVMVAPDAADGGPDLSGARLFLVDGRTGINYRAGVWHHPMTVLDRDAVFATVMFNDGGDRDEDWADLPVEVELSL